MNKIILRRVTDGSAAKGPRTIRLVLRGSLRSCGPPMDRKSICERLTKNWPPSNGFLLKKMATPRWACMQEIKAIYVECRRISAETGVKHHVDHEIPLKGYKVCGLHTPANLRIIPAIENIKKRNKYEVDM